MTEPQKLLILTSIVLFMFSALAWTIYTIEDLKEAKEYQRNYLIGYAPHFYFENCFEVQGKITKYNALEEQTDSTPFITATGQRVREGIIANNCLKFGTYVEIDGIFYTVADRLNQRYGCEHYDIFCWDLEEAMEYGCQTKAIKVCY
jgi:3D (Asp-Asp-Asp) domain-containing protein